MKRMLLAVLVAGTTGCLDGSGPGAGTPPILPGLVVSTPVQSSALQRSGAASAASAVGAEVAYVSLAPGSVPAGRQAIIRNQTTDQAVSAVVVDGGFDPVALVANVGDTLLVEIPRAGFTEPLRGAEVVRRGRRPVVVRTSPPRGGRDVPLNSTMVIVFSEPINATTLTTGSVQLWRGTTPMAGSVRFADAAGVRAEFHADSLFAPQTRYQLVVTRAIQDVNGLPLDSAVTVPFTTGSTPPAQGLVFASVSAGYLHTCGVTPTGDAYCWGASALGTGDSTPHLTFSPVLVAGGLSFAAVAAGDFHTCGRTAARAGYCWGANEDGGQLGDGTTINRSSPVPVAGGLSFAAVSAGGFHTCGVTAASDAYCWGYNYAGELGEGTTTDHLTPGLVTGGVSFAAVSAGLFHTCGVTVAGAAYCWGANGDPGTGDGRLGDGTSTNRSSPALVMGGLTFAAVSAGYYHTCGLTVSGDAYCWGKNADGQLGDGTNVDRSSPVLVAGGLTFVAVSAGGFHTCGLTAGGDAYCWGANVGGAVGDATPEGASLTPMPVTGGLSFAAVSAGFEYTCGVTAAGTAYCWGANWVGQLGDGTSTDSSVPVKVAGQP